MNFNLFDWLRDGVKNSVLLGVTDAVKIMGVPHDDSTKSQILGFLQNDPDGDTPVRRIVGSSSSSSTKKLGRSLNDIAAKEAS